MRDAIRGQSEARDGRWGRRDTKGWEVVYLGIPGYTRIVHRVSRPSYSNSCKEVELKMAICDNCKKTPLEYREVNHVHKGDKEVVLCDKCYRMAFQKEYFKN
jgi:hypothetical protein